MYLKRTQPWITVSLCSSTFTRLLLDGVTVVNNTIIQTHKTYLEHARAVEKIKKSTD